MSTSLPNPLLSWHQQAQAEFQSYADLEIVTTFGQPQAEYAAIHKSAALMDMSHRGLLELTGKDRLSFLNNLLSNETFNKSTKTGLPAGQGIYSFFLNNKGRIITDMNVLELGDRTLLEMDARLVSSTLTLLDKYLFADQVKLTSRIGSLHQIAFYGPSARDLLSQAIELPVPAMPSLASIPAKIFNTDAIIWRDDITGTPGYHLILPLDSVTNVWNNLLARFSKADQLGKRPLRPIGWAAFNSTRIEAGRPLFGIDFDESILPAETGQLDRAVSFTKGCYIGQEIVARMYSRGQYTRQLVGIKMDSDALPLAGTKIFDDQQNEIGGITSSTLSPVLSDTAIALGYARRAFLSPGTPLYIPAEGTLHKGTVTLLPFISHTNS